MTGKELFEAAVRIIGLWSLLTGLAHSTGLFWPSKGHTGREYVKGAVMYSVAGILLLFGGGLIAQFVYR